jgi:diacylglycerol kinase (ATP)
MCSTSRISHTLYFDEDRLADQTSASASTAPNEEFSRGEQKRAGPNVIPSSALSEKRDLMKHELDIIVNPASRGGRTRRRWPELKRQIIAQGFTIQEHQTSGRQDATRITQDLLKAGAREIVVVGGDGTLNEVVNGFFDHGEPIASEATLSIIPCGTGQDFCRSLRIDSDEQAIRQLAVGVAQPIDIGFIRYGLNGAKRGQTRCFINVADVGLGAETAARINRSGKAFGGFLSYLLEVVRTIAVYRGRQADIVVDGEVVHSGPVGMVVLANGRYLAGGMLIAPTASFTDGLLDVLVLRDVPKRTLLGSLLPRVYRGRHIGHPAVLHARGREVQIRCDHPIPFEVDGEQPGTTDLEAVVLPRALRVRMPYIAAVRRG